MPEMTLEDYKMICSATSLPCREPQGETIAPPRWWITFTPYGLLEWVLKYDDYSKERVFGILRAIYMRECIISLRQWQREYALIQVIKELMER